MPIFGQVDPPSSDNTAGEFADGIKQQVETAGRPCGDYSDDDNDDDYHKNGLTKDNDESDDD